MSEADAVELDPGVLQGFVQAIRLPRTLLDLGLAIPGQIPQRADGLGGHKARSEQPGLGELAQPLGILDVGLATRDLLDVPGVDQHALKPVLKDPPTRAARRPRSLPSRPASHRTP